MEVTGSGPVSGWFVVAVLFFENIIIVWFSTILALIVAWVKNKNKIKASIWGFTMGWFYFPMVIKLIAGISSYFRESVDVGYIEHYDEENYAIDSVDSNNNNIEFENMLKELEEASIQQERDPDFRPSYVSINDSVIHELIK